MDKLTKIIDADAAVRAFLDEWYADTDYITAHTSGSTGVPKEIRLKKADMEVSARATCQKFGITDTSFMVMPLSAHYIAGKMMIVRAMVSGAKLKVVAPSRNLDGLASIDTPIDLLPIVPSQISGLLKHLHIIKVRNVIVGGAPLSVTQERTLADSGVCAYASYGMTETCSHVALRRIGVNDIFEAMPGIEFKVDDDGCLIIDAPYYSECRFVTNDQVELIDSQHFRWLGRKDFVINTGGIKVFAEEVERCLLPYFSNENFYITSRESEVWGQEIVMVVATNGIKRDFSDNLCAAAETLPHHLLPKAIIQVPEHRYTDTGKLIRLKDFEI